MNFKPCAYTQRKLFWISAKNLVVYRSSKNPIPILKNVLLNIDKKLYLVRSEIQALLIILESLFDPEEELDR